MEGLNEIDPLDHVITLSCKSKTKNINNNGKKLQFQKEDHNDIIWRQKSINCTTEILDIIGFSMTWITCTLEENEAIKSKCLTTTPKYFCSWYPILISMSHITENLGLITNIEGISHPIY